MQRATWLNPHNDNRYLAARIGLVPKQNSSGGKERLGGITKQRMKVRYDNLH